MQTMMTLKVVFMALLAYSRKRLVGLLNIPRFTDNDKNLLVALALKVEQRMRRPRLGYLYDKGTDGVIHGGGISLQSTTTICSFHQR